MVLAEEKKDKAPLLNRQKVRNAIKIFGGVLFFGAVAALVLWWIFGLEAGVFSFLAMKAVVVPLALAGTAILGAVILWISSDEEERDGSGVLAGAIGVFIGITAAFTAFSGGIHTEIEEKQVQREIAQQYETKHHVNDVIISRIADHDTTHGKVIMYRVTSPELKKGDYVAVYGHGSTIDSWKVISKREFEAL